MSRSPAIKVHGLRHRYDAREVLALDDWSVAHGERWLIVGASGSGKTTLIHLLAGLLAPTEGTIELDGVALDTLSSGARDRFRARRVGIVFQRHYLLAALSVVDNLLLAQYLAGLPQDRGHCARVLGALGLEARRHDFPSRLSQGQAQRVALARALVNAPMAVFADEPTASLDDANCHRVIALLEEQAAARDATLLVASHDRRLEEHFDRRLELPLRA